jgi:hypothetical protein
MQTLLQPRSKPMRKIAASLGAFALVLFFAPQAGRAQFARGGGGGGGGGVHIGSGGVGHFGGGGGGGVHIGGGGMGHFGGGDSGVHIGGGGVGHFGGGGMPHFEGGGAVHFGGHPITPRTAHFGGPRIGRAYGPHGIQGAPPHGFPGALRTYIPGRGRIGRIRHGPAVAAINPRFTVAHIGHVSPFADRQRLLARGPLHAFARNRWLDWGHHHHRGWFGPIFWPYAYGDFFYFALWPDDYAYDDPFWYYGYDDIYDGIFWPYDYTDYVRGRRAPARMRALTHAVAQSCAGEAAEVTGWPIDQIQAALEPSPQQKALLDGLSNAVVKASDVIKAHCPTAVSFTPTGRIGAMQERLDGLVQAVNIVQPPLAKFYDALSDEQKARFNEIGAPSGKKKPEPGQMAAQVARGPNGECDQNVMAFPTERIDRVLHPDAAQRAKLDALRAANTKAADVIKAACPSTLPVAPPDRLVAEGQRLQAMLTAVKTIRPPLDAFYNALSDEQKARFNTLGRRLFARQ